MSELKVGLFSFTAHNEKLKMTLGHNVMTAAVQDKHQRGPLTAQSSTHHHPTYSFSLSYCSSSFSSLSSFYGDEEKRTGQYFEGV